MKIAIIDADLVGKKKHRFPNLVSMKLSGYYKELGNDVELKLDYEDLQLYDKVFISKVFTDTPIREEVLNYGKTTLCIQTISGASASANELCNKGCKTTKAGRWFYRLYKMCFLI